jgi:hypothetical protein
MSTFSTLHSLIGGLLNETDSTAVAAAVVQAVYNRVKVAASTDAAKVGLTVLVEAENELHCGCASGACSFTGSLSQSVVVVSMWQLHICSCWCCTTRLLAAFAAIPTLSLLACITTDQVHHPPAACLCRCLHLGIMSRLLLRQSMQLWSPQRSFADCWPSQPTLQISLQQSVR